MIDALATGARRRLGNSGSTGSFSDDPLFCLNTLSEYLFDEVGFRATRKLLRPQEQLFERGAPTPGSGFPSAWPWSTSKSGNGWGFPSLGLACRAIFWSGTGTRKTISWIHFIKGILLTPEECAERLERLVQTDFTWDPKQLDPVGNREILSRVLRNLKGIYQQSQEYAKLLKVEDLLVALQPARPQERRDRGFGAFCPGALAGCQGRPGIFPGLHRARRGYPRRKPGSGSDSKIQRPGGGAGR